MDKRFTEINNSIATLMGWVDDMEKHLEELESTGALKSFMQRCKWW